MIVRIKLKLEKSESSDCDSSSFKGKVSEFEKETDCVGIAIYNALKGVDVCRAICALAVAVDMFRHDGVSGDSEEAFCDEAENVIKYWHDNDANIQSILKAKQTAE